jgi:hypothetical protein
MGMKFLYLFWAIIVMTGLGACKSSTDDTEAPRSGGVYFSDEFDPGDTGDWYLETDAEGSSAVIGESMVITINVPNSVQYSTLRNHNFGDFVLEVEATQLEGNPSNSHGVLFRMRSPSEFYRFDITADGNYVIERRNADGTWSRLLDDWTPSPAISQGLNNTNRIKVVAEGAKLTFFVNDQELQTITDNAYLSGNIALDVGTFGQTASSVAFDNVIVRRP